MDEWSDVDLYRIVELFGKFPRLWDRRQPDYHDPHLRYQSYCQILQGLCMPCASVSDVVSILRELRSAYVSELQKMQADIANANARAVGGCTYRPAKWFWVMHGFLYDHLDADERHGEFPKLKPLAHSSFLTDECVCEVCDIATKNVSTTAEDYPRIEAEEVTPVDEKKWDKVDEENEVAPGCGKFSVTSVSHKGEILFIRAPRELKAIRMNTVYEFSDRRIAITSKILSKDEVQYDTCNGGTVYKGDVVKNVSEKICCWMNKGACLSANKSQVPPNNRDNDEKPETNDFTRPNVQRIDRSTSGEIIYCCVRSRSPVHQE